MARQPLPDPTVVLVCDKCGASGPANEVFYLVKSGPRAGALMQSHCRECEYARVRGYEVKNRYRRKVGPRKPPPKDRRHVVLDGVECRPCTKCEEMLPLDRFTFQKRKSSSGSYASHCKACRTKFEREQRLAGKREIPPDVRRTRAREQAIRHREAKRMAVRRRRARLRGNGGTVTLWEWEQTLEAWKHRCAYCDVHAAGDGDHVVHRQIARGGEHVVENVVPACGKKHNNCNARKAARTGREFYQATDGSGPLRAVA